MVVRSMQALRIDSGRQHGCFGSVAGTRAMLILTSVQHDGLCLGPLSQGLHRGKSSRPVALFVLLAEGHPGYPDVLDALHHIIPLLRSSWQSTDAPDAL